MDGNILHIISILYDY